MPSSYTGFTRASVPAHYLLETCRKLIKTTEAASIHAENSLRLCEVGLENAPAKASRQTLAPDFDP
jgi:hypothetical protein